MAKAAKSAKCNCNWGWAIVALVLFTAGLWGLANAFISQLGGAAAVQALPWYFVSLLVLMLGKLAKWSAHGKCPVHSK